MKNNKECIKNDFNKQKWLEKVKKTNRIFNEAKVKKDGIIREVKNDNK